MSNLGVSSYLLEKILDTYLGKLEVKKPNLIVIGYGWAGKAFTDKIDKEKYNVTIVSNYPAMLNTTKLKNSILNDYDKQLLISKKEGLNYILGKCTDIKENDKSITVKPNFSIKDTQLKFDYLIVAVGSEPNDFGLTGVQENCYFLKSLKDLDELRHDFQKGKFKNNNSQRINKKDLKITVLGGGPAGIEIAFELSKKYKNIQIIEALDTILPMFSEETVKIVKEELDKAGIKLLLSNKVSKIDKSTIYAGDIKYSYDLSIWTCGIKPNILVNKKTKNKFKFSDCIYGIGDIVASKELGPPTGQNAKQQGEYLAEYFNNNFKGEPYQYKEKGKIIHTKDWIVMETAIGTFRLPTLVEPLIDYIIT